LDSGLGQQHGFAFAGDDQDAVERDRLFTFGDLTVDLDGVTGGDLELGSAVFNDRVHRCSVIFGKKRGGYCVD